MIKKSMTINCLGDFYQINYKKNNNNNNYGINLGSGMKNVVL